VEGDSERNRWPLNERNDKHDQVAALKATKNETGGRKTGERRGQTGAAFRPQAADFGRRPVFPIAPIP
jgi:hypothetical protein